MTRTYDFCKNGRIKIVVAIEVDHLRERMERLVPNYVQAFPDVYDVVGIQSTLHGVLPV